jgi:energy-converting hydrogenase Eha subunit C
MSDVPHKPSAPPAILHYQGDDPRIAGKLRSDRDNTQATIGGAISIFLTLGTAIHTLVVKHPLRWIPTIGLLVYGMLVVVALYKYRRYNSTLFAQGVALGTGIGLFLAALLWLYAKF